jgi:uncharacterized RDD family membrane protein YckC
MTDRTSEFVFVGFWKRVLAALIDAAIGWGFMPIAVSVTIWSFEHGNVFPEILWSVIWTAVWLWPVVRFGITPGKLVIRARIVNGGGQFLSWRRAVLRILPALIMSMNSFFQMGTAIGRYPERVPQVSFWEIGWLLNEYGEPYTTVAAVFGFFIYADLGVVLLNRQKRAMHDFIAGSYVITKDSYQALAEPNVLADAVKPCR